ncbi:hypothetical protein IMZ29_16490 [Achromobacter sp. GG226]|uniref:glycosyl hydrolase family 18 protein n=1 Tax=Verticiella alkaliphila TaxID=2779529 RepID=UPI001C0C4C6D|nr:glycosyl hydrolase family 18 protein [Verticiella sp. GG226]MBU4612080.1 hypothetical protein [Verticiella sp. GG226]
MWRARSFLSRRWLCPRAWLLVVLAGLTACGGGDDPRDSPEPARPIAAAWFYLSDTQDYQTIPEDWARVDFRAVDRLHVGPAGIQPDGRFGLFQSAQTGDLRHRFEWVIDKARRENPAIEVVVSQWWGRGEGVWGRSLDVLDTPAARGAYAQSMADFLAFYRRHAGGRYAVDGVDIDYEGENVVPAFPEIAGQIRTALRTLSDQHGRPYLFTVTPADDEYLTPASLAQADFVNLQSYAGGLEFTLDLLYALDVAPSKILLGICPETDCDTFSETDVLAGYREEGLAGIHLWRLNSDNQDVEGDVQRRIHAALHP